MCSMHTPICMLLPMVCNMRMYTSDAHPADQASKDTMCMRMHMHMYACPIRLPRR